MTRRASDAGQSARILWERANGMAGLGKLIGQAPGCPIAPGTNYSCVMRDEMQCGSFVINIDKYLVGRRQSLQDMHCISMDREHTRLS